MDHAGAGAAAAGRDSLGRTVRRRRGHAERVGLADERGDDVVFFDGRNAFEAEIGRFKNAVVPDVATTRDFVAELESGRYDHLKNKPVVNDNPDEMQIERLRDEVRTGDDPGERVPSLRSRCAR